MSSRRCGRVLVTIVLVLVTAVMGVLAGSSVESEAAGLLGDGTAVNHRAASHTITATAGANGSISPSGAVEVGDGADQAFMITPDPGYRIEDVLVDGVSVGPMTRYTFTAVLRDHTIHASFAKATFTITPSAGANGSVNPGTPQTVVYGAEQAFTITPDPGYRIEDVLVDGVSVGPVTIYAFTAVTADHTIHASFAIATFTITPSAGANGIISPGTPQTVAYGAEQAFTITPAVGHHVADVLVDGVSVGPVTSYVFQNVTADHAISASFAPSVRTRLSLSVAQAVVNFGSSTLLTGVLYDSGDPLREVGMGDRLVAVQTASSATGPWTHLEALTTSSVAGFTGTCTLTVTPTVSTYYRLRFVAGAGIGYGSSLSLVVRVGVRPVLGTPRVPASVRAGQSFTVSGTLTPKFTAGQKTVQIKVYRNTSRRVVFIKQVSATNTDSGGTTRYGVKVKLLARGQYRFRAYIAPSVTWTGNTTRLSTVLTVR